jgi:hypothetical protein
MATTTHGCEQDRGSGMTRRDVLRWVGSVAAAGALAAAGHNGLSGSVHAKRRGKQRRKRRQVGPRVAATRALEMTSLPGDEAAGELAFYGDRCRRRWVCYPDGVCTQRVVCR